MTTLEKREGLPDALRVLLDEFPREVWEAHDNFGQLVQFWLSRHLMFRDLLTRMEHAALEVRDAAGNPDRLVRSVGHYGNLLVGNLHQHHQIEDKHYFPLLKGLDARIEVGFDLLDADHHALDGYIAGFADAANNALHGVQTGESAVDHAAAFLDGLGRLARLLDRHLTDEEDLIVPVILKHGEPTF